MSERPSDPHPEPPAAKAAETEDPYEARFDAELARMDEHPLAAHAEELDETFERAHARGLGNYLGLYARSTPWWVWARRLGLMWLVWAMSPAGTSAALRVGLIAGAVLIEGVASFVWRGLHRPKPQADESPVTTGAGAHAGGDDDRDEARLDAELEKLDRSE